jgi:hypothetical protein
MRDTALYRTPAGGEFEVSELGGRRLQRLQAPPDQRNPGAFGVGLAGELGSEAARGARDEEDTASERLAPVAEDRDGCRPSHRSPDQSGGGREQHWVSPA